MQLQIMQSIFVVFQYLKPPHHRNIQLYADDTTFQIFLYGRRKTSQSSVNFHQQHVSGKKPTNPFAVLRHLKRVLFCSSRVILLLSRKPLKPCRKLETQVYICHQKFIATLLLYETVVLEGEGDQLQMRNECVLLILVGLIHLFN